MIDGPVPRAPLEVADPADVAPIGSPVSAPATNALAIEGP
jgi:hypothetical protein